MLIHVFALIPWHWPRGIIFADRKKTGKRSREASNMLGDEMSPYFDEYLHLVAAEGRAEIEEMTRRAISPQFSPQRRAQVTKNSALKSACRPLTGQRRSASAAISLHMKPGRS